MFQGTLVHPTHRTDFALLAKGLTRLFHSVVQCTKPEAGFTAHYSISAREVGLLVS